MIKVDVRNVIISNLNDGETEKSVILKLDGYAKYHIFYHLDGSNANLGTSFKTIQEFKDEIATTKDPFLLKKFHDSVLNHIVGYLGEIAVHSILKHDWHQVFESNHLTKYFEPDGKLDDGRTFDVKTRSKNYEGLAVSAKQLANQLQNKSAADIFILCHYKSPAIYVVGYASRDEVLAARRNSYGNYTIAVDDLHPIEELL